MRNFSPDKMMVPELTKLLPFLRLPQLVGQGRPVAPCRSAPGPRSRALPPAHGHTAAGPASRHQTTVCGQAYRMIPLIWLPGVREKTQKNLEIKLMSIHVNLYVPETANE